MTGNGTAETKSAVLDPASVRGRGLLILLAAAYLSVLGAAGWFAVGFLRENAFLLDGPVYFYEMEDAHLQPTIRRGEQYLVWTGYYAENAPQYGDIAIFSLMEDPPEYYISRIVGLPGDLMQTVQGELWIDGEALKRERLATQEVAHPDSPDQVVTVTEYREHYPNGHHHLIWEEGTEGLFDKPSLTLVPEGQVLVLEDYRDNWSGNLYAEVGRLILIEQLHDRAEVIVWSDDWSRIGLRLHDEK